MNDHFISDELYLELLMLPVDILLTTSMCLREEWLENPTNGEALMGALITMEALAERGFSLPEVANDARTEAAIAYFNSVMGTNWNLFGQ